MSDPSQTYYYGRLNVAGVYTDKQAFLSKGLTAGASIESYGHIWQIGEVGYLESFNGPFFHGYLVKYKREVSEETFEPGTGQIGDVSIPNIIVAKARFFLHIESGIIAYHPVPGDIDYDQFRTQFARLFKKNHDDGFFVDADVQAIEQQYAIRDELRKMTVVNRITISLHPSNPSMRDEWKDIDERLKKLGTRSYKETYVTKPGVLEGSDIIQDEELLAKLLMAEDGYGNAKIKGKIDGDEVIIKTHDKPVTSEAPGEDTPPGLVLDSLMIVLRSIFARFNKHED